MPYLHRTGIFAFICCFPSLVLCQDRVPQKVVEVRTGTQERFLSVGAVTRHYRLYVPMEGKNVKNRPLVVILHGGGGTSRAASYEMQWDKKADREGFLAAYGDALPPDPEKPSHFATNPQLWNDGSGRFYQGQTQTDDVGYINAMLDDLLQQNVVDPERIYVTGFSNGASMAFRAGVELSDRIAAIAPVAGALWLQKVKLKRPVSMCYMTGTADPLNLIGGGVPKLLGGQSDPVRAKPKPPVMDSIHRWCLAAGCSVEPVTTTSQNGVRVQTYLSDSRGVEVLYVTVEGMGHTWPGGRSILPQSMVGALSDKLKAVDYLWDFFCKHTLSGHE